MRLLDKHIQRELIGPFIFGVMAFSSVFFAGSYLQKLTQWVMNGLPFLTAIKLFVLLLPPVIVYTLPMAMLLAVLLGIGRMSGDSEVVALFACGVSLYRMVVPVVVMGAIISLGAIAMNEIVVPRAHLQYADMEAAILKQVSPSDQPFTVKDEATNSRIDVNGGMDSESGVLRDVTITHYANNRPVIVIYAERAKWAGIRDESKRYEWRLYNGFQQLIGTTRSAMLGFEQTHTTLEKTPEEMSLYQQSNLKNTDQLSFKQLTEIIAQERKNPTRTVDRIRQLEVDRWNKLALPLSSFVFAMLAAPLGIRPSRSSSSVGFGLSILLIFLYWMIWHYTSSLAAQGNLAPIYGSFLADGLGIMAALILLKRAAK